MRPEKQLLLEEIKDYIDQSAAIVITRYERLNPNAAANFRMTLGKSGGVFEVVRKRIFLKAAQASGIEFSEDALQGHIGVVFALKDPVQVTKTLYEFSKENEEIFQVLGGRFEGNICSASDIEQLSKLPSKEEMRAQFLGLLEAPMAQTLSVVESLLTSVVYCLDNKSQEGQKS